MDVRIFAEEKDPALVEALFRQEDRWAYVLSLAKLVVSPFQVYGVLRTVGKAPCRPACADFGDS